METIRFLMKVNAVQVRIFGIGHVEGKIVMNYLFYYSDVFASLNVYDTEIKHVF